ncbi:MAG: nucleotide-binding universal stress UspA family protein [Arenicella sp.]|jgi:nucleotide-binding universal stress UspA family protein
MFNDISVCVNDIQDRDYALIAACQFAERHNAKLTAFYIKFDSIEVLRWRGTSPTELAKQLLVDQDAREENAKALFKTLTSKYSCQKSWKTASQSSNPFGQVLCTDIIFAEQPKPGQLFNRSDQGFLNQLILESKRPIVMIPYGWELDLLAKKVLLGWNASAEAMRAVSDALPILKESEELCVLDIVVEKLFADEQHHTYALEDYLTAKDIDFKTIIEHASGQLTAPRQLTDYAKLENSDLIVVGGYGHSRLRETVLGGMTDYLINKSTIPVFFSH